MLERTIGSTVKSSPQLAVNPRTGDVAYPAGCVVVVYSARKNRQTRFFLSKNHKAVACVAFSASGKYLAVGEVQQCVCV